MSFIRVLASSDTDRQSGHLSCDLTLLTKLKSTFDLMQCCKQFFFFNELFMKFSKLHPESKKHDVSVCKYVGPNFLSYKINSRPFPVRKTLT